MKNNYTDDGGPFYKADLVGSEWTNVQGLGGDLSKFFDLKNDSIWNSYENPDGIFFGYYIYGGSISSDGMEFYFSTDVHTKYGKLDIWVSKLKDGVWQYPQNLGPKVNIINAMNIEPQISYDNKILYYSCDKIEERGDGDLVYCIRNIYGEFDNPHRLGDEINSDRDDRQITIPVNGNSVFVTVLDRNNNSSKNIYEIKLSATMKILPNFTVIRGYIFDEKNHNPVEAEIKIKNTSLDINSYITKSDPITGEYSIILQNGMDYEVTVENDNYNSYIVKYNPGDLFGEAVVNISLKTIHDDNLISIEDNKEINNKNILVYPNPASEQLHVAFNEDMNVPGMQIVITNISGEEVYREKINAKHTFFDIDISPLSSGVFFLNIIEDKGIKYSVKFVKY
ncbi:T9SS type A sorting domain-containing protein [Bacteroidota bacterium]